MSTFKYQHLNCNEEGKFNDLLENEIGVKTSEGEEGIYLKKGNGEVASFPTKEQVESVIKNSVSSFITEEDADNKYQEKGDYLTEHQDLSDYALKTDIPSLEGYATEEWVESKGYLTEHQSLEDYAKSDEVTSEINGAIEGLNISQYETIDGASEKYQEKGDYATNEEVALKADTTAMTESIAAVKAELNSAIDGKVSLTSFNEYKGEVSASLADKIEAGDVENFFDTAVYDEENQKILFKHGDTVKAEVDASVFIKDGMVDSVEIKDGNLEITFNEESGKETIKIAVNEIFNAQNYYTKAEVDAELSKKQNTGIYVSWSEYEGRKIIQLENRDAISAKISKGGGANLIMLSGYEGLDFDVTEVGSTQTALVLNSCEGVAKIQGPEGQKTVATEDQIPSLDGYATSSAVSEEINSAVAAKLDTETYNADKETFATKTEVAEVEGKIPSLDGYAKTDEVENVLKDYPKYEPYVNGDINKKTITLDNDDNISGKRKDGLSVNLVEVSRWDVADFGSKSVHINFNGAFERPTYNDKQGIALLGDVENLKNEMRDYFTALLKNYALKSDDEIAKAISAGGDVVLVSNVKSTKGYTLTKEADVDLNGHTLDAVSNGNYGDNIVVGNGANVTISNGEIKPAESASVANASATIIIKTAYESHLTLNDVKVTGIHPVYLNSANENSTVTINGGEFYTTMPLEGVSSDSMAPAVYVGKGATGSVIGGKVTINGGTFGQKGVVNNFLLNVEDVLRKQEGKEPRNFIEVFGGKFWNFDPSNNKAEGEGTNFVADGYHVESKEDGEDTIFTVVKNLE